LEPELETMKKKKKRRKEEDEPVLPESESRVSLCCDCEEDVSRRTHQFIIPFSRSSRTVRTIERKERKE